MLGTDQQQVPEFSVIAISLNVMALMESYSVV